jgi:hypothetical protein
MLIDEENFYLPLEASILRVLIKKPDDIPDEYVFLAEVFACYEDVPGSQLNQMH